MDYYKYKETVFYVPNMTGTGWMYNRSADAFVPVQADAVMMTNPISERGFREHIEEYRREAHALKNKASSFAKDRHRGQKDKAGKEYFEAHITKVAELVEQMFGGGYLPVIAYLHDLMEDTKTVELELREMFPDEVVDAVVSLTRNSKETYMEYIQRVKRNPLAVQVKICDLIQNMDLTRLPNPTENDRRRVMKYSQALAELTRPEGKEEER